MVPVTATHGNYATSLVMGPSWNVSRHLTRGSEIWREARRSQSTIWVPPVASAETAHQTLGRSLLSLEPWQSRRRMASCIDRHKRDEGGEVRWGQPWSRGGGRLRRLRSWLRR